MELEYESDFSVAECADFLAAKGSDIGPVYEKRAFVRCLERAKYLQQRGFAGS